MLNYKVNEMADHYLAGKTLAQVGERFGCAESSVYRLLKPLGILRPRNLDEAKRQKIVSLRQQGKKGREICSEANCSLTAVYHILKREGLSTRKVRFMTEPDIQKAIELYREGYCLKSVGESLGYSDNAIRNNIAKKGIEIRNRIEAQSLWRKAKNPDYVPGRVKNNCGYIEIKAPDHPRATKKGYVREHILVWEAVHGELPKGMIIHHLNGIKDDNRLENLVALPIRTHIHAKVKDLFIKQLQKRLRRLENQGQLSLVIG